MRFDEVLDYWSDMQGTSSILSNLPEGELVLNGAAVGPEGRLRLVQDAQKATAEFRRIEQRLKDQSALRQAAEYFANSL